MLPLSVACRGRERLGQGMRGSLPSNHASFTSGGGSLQEQVKQIEGNLPAQAL